MCNNLDLINYYIKFIPNLLTLLHPLNSVLQSNKKWCWSTECSRAFQNAKNQLTSACILTHYNPNLPITLAADGVGSVISHIFSVGFEHPIAFASHTLTSAEKNYAQLEKEALALTFGVKKFHRYLYGHNFTLITDHKPLVTIIGPKKGIPSLAAAHLQRWAILLSANDYTIQYKSATNHGSADGLSRLSLPSTLPDLDSQCITTFNNAQVQALPVTFRKLPGVIPYLAKSIVTHKRDGPPRYQRNFNLTNTVRINLVLRMAV